MKDLQKWEDVRRTSPEKVEEYRRWAPYAADGATLADLRRLVGLTQQQMGERMKVSDVEAGRFEKRQDVQLSTLRRYLAALGGELEVYARFGDSGEKLIPLRFGPGVTGAAAVRTQAAGNVAGGKRGSKRGR